MDRKKLEYLTIQHFVFLSYIVLTSMIFYISVIQGNEGVSIQLFGGGDDGYFYWEQASNILEGKPWIKTSIYPLLLGIIMKITGIRNVYIIRIFNYIGFLLLVLFSVWIVRTQYSNIKEKNKKVYKSMNLLLFTYLTYTSLQMYTNLSIYRDIWIYTLYVLCTFLSIKFILCRGHRLIYFIIWCLSVLLLGEFRRYAMLSFLLGVGVYFIYYNVKKTKKIKLFLFLGIIGFAIYYKFFIDFSILGMSLREALSYRELAMGNIYSGGSQMWISLNQPNFVGFIINYIHSYIGNFIGPLPWHIYGGSTLLVFIAETIPMILILVFLYRRRKKITNIQQYILIQGFVWISLIGFTNDNIGTASRLRVVAWILILCVFVVVYQTDRNLKKENLL